jgi:hypothetical protein
MRLMTGREIVLSAALIGSAIAGCAGCATIEHTRTYAVQNKKALYDHYAALQKEKPVDAKSDDAAAVYAARTIALGDVFRSNLPLKLTDEYDVRDRMNQKIRPGDPLNIIINKIRLKENHERKWLFENSADVAVVVTVDDGKESEPKHVIVAYETNVGQSIKLPDDNLLAYASDSYNDEPVRIEVTLLALYGARNKTYTQILSAAAGIGAATAPAYAPAISAASQVGRALINAKQDNIVAKFTFQLYPWKIGSTSAHEQVGVPRVTYGQYFLGSTREVALLDGHPSIQLDYHLVPYQVGNQDGESVKALSAGTFPPWPTPSLAQAPTERLDLTYVVLTVENTKLNRAQSIINRADAANRALAQLANDNDISMGRIRFVDAQLDDIKSKLRLQAARGAFNRSKGSGVTALNGLIAASGDSSLSETDKNELLDLARSVLPPEADGSDVAKMKAWLTSNGSELVYQRKTGTYCLRATKGCES